MPKGAAYRRVSVIIASREDEQLIRARVRDACSTGYPSEAIEVIVARDQRSADSTPFVMPDVASVTRVVQGDLPGGKACTLNAAVRAATGEVLVFTDTAQRFQPHAVLRLVEALEDPRLGAVSGSLKLRDEGAVGGRATLAELYWRFERWLRGEEARVHSAVGVTGAIYAMRSKDWRPLPSGVLNEDLYIPMELVLRGYRIGFARDAQAVDDRRFQPAQEYQRKVRTLTGVLQLCFWLPAVLVPVRNPIWLQFVFHKLLRLLTPYLILLALFAVLAAGFVARGDGFPGAAWLGVVALGVPLLVWFASRRARGALAMGIAMQLAVVRAMWNGLRGEWDVWRR